MRSEMGIVASHKFGCKNIAPESFLNLTPFGKPKIAVCTVRPLQRGTWDTHTFSPALHNPIDLLWLCHCIARLVIIQICVIVVAFLRYFTFTGNSYCWKLSTSCIFWRDVRCGKRVWRLQFCSDRFHLVSDQLMTLHYTTLHYIVWNVIILKQCCISMPLICKKQKLVMKCILPF